MTRTGTISEQVGNAFNTVIVNASSCLPCCVASVVRHIYLRPGVGVGGLRKVYGGKNFNK